MLFFEDFMELIDSLPDDFRRNLTTVRTLDLSVQNRIEPLDQKIEGFFSRFRQPGLDIQLKQKLHEEIVSDFEKALKESDEKVFITKQLNDTMAKVMKKLDMEVSKFRCELEADNAGITEVIEKRVMDQEKTAAQNLRLERKRARHMRLNGSSRQGGTLGPGPGGLVCGSGPSSHLSLNGSTSGSNSVDLTSRLDLSCSKDALMTSVAVPLNSQVNSPVPGTNPMLFGPSAPMVGAPRRHTNSSGRSSVPENPSVGGRSGPPRKKMKHCASFSTDEEAPFLNDDFISAEPSEEVWEFGGSSGGGAGAGDSDDAVYCICRDISHGVMVACDNDDCEIEWFHCRCVGLTVPPKGKWFCPQCRDGNNASRPKKGRR